MELTGPPSQLTPSTSQGIPDPSSVEPEAMDTGALASSSAAESEEVSEGSSEVEDSSSAESGPAHSGPAKGGTGGRSGTAAGTKRKPEVGPTLPQSKTKNLRARLESTLVSAGTFQLTCTNFVPGVTTVSQVLSYFIFLHFIYFATWWLVTPYQDLILRRLHILSSS